MGKIEAEDREEGTPQGGVISPLLANIYLNPLDHLMANSKHEMVRYADDMVILCPSAEAANEVLQTLREWSCQAGLRLHPEKTKIIGMGQPKACFDFLGAAKPADASSGLSDPRARRNSKPASSR